MPANLPIRNVLVTGGAGYVGSALVPQLLDLGYWVRVLDLYLYGDDVLCGCRGSRLEEIRGDVRDAPLLSRILSECDAVIHLAGISNDPSVDLDPALSRSINFDSFGPLVRESIAAGVRRFIFASSASVYGISDQPSVGEDHPLKPVSEYNRLKAACESLLFEHQAPEFTTVAVRPATLCGYAPRLRLDLTVNILTAQAVERRNITVFGGEQRRPCLHLDDMVDLYCLLLRAPAEWVHCQIFNVGYENLSVADIATLVKEVVEHESPNHFPIRIETQPSEDPRTYHICSDKIRRQLGFAPRRTIGDAVRSLLRAFSEGKIPHALSDEKYYNVKVLKRIQSRLLKGNGNGGG